MSQYCISDIHGCSKTLTALLAQLNLTNKDTVFFLGDYVDRGPDSKGVLDIVMGMPNAVCHKGNHEDMLLLAVDNPTDPSYTNHWFVNGGKAALKSFGGEMPQRYIDFLRGLHLLTELPDFYLCHAGIAHDVMNTPEEVLLWDRYCEVDLSRTGGKRLVCGHTPQELDDITDNVRRDKIIIDGGCVFKDAGYGNLVALRLDDMKLFIQPNVEG